MLTEAERNRNALVEAYLPLARKLAARAKRRLPASVELDDLVGEACVGLLEAASRYDETSEVRFGVYAVRRIWGAMIDRHRRAHYRFETHEALPPSGVQASAMPDHDARIDAARRTGVVAGVLAALPERERRVLVLHYRDELSLTEIGARTGSGKDRARYERRRGLEAARRELAARGIRRAA